MVNIDRPFAVVVSAHVAPRERNPAFLSVMSAKVFNRSVSTAPPSWAGSHQHVVGIELLKRWERLVWALLAVSRNTFLQPTLANWPTWASTLSPSVETLT